MAFSYSDKNFTVIGNLCFVHIRDISTGNVNYKVPPAIANRMLVDKFRVIFCSCNIDGSGPSTASCYVNGGTLSFSNNKEVAYVNFSFPIDSNK